MALVENDRARETRFVIRAALVLLFSAALAVGAENWQQTLTVSPGNFPPPRALNASYRFGWSALGAGEAEAIFSKTADQFRLEVKGGTRGFVRSLWRMDATHSARADADTLRPVSVRQMEWYPWQTLRTELDFSDDAVVRFRESKPGDKTPPKRKRIRFPNLFDIHSAFLFLRSQRLRAGDSYNVVVYPASTPYLATIRVIGREKLSVHAGNYNALKAELKLQKVTREGTLEPHPKFKRGYVWLSDDADRLLLKVQAEIFVGSVWMELQNARFLK